MRKLAWVAALGLAGLTGNTIAGGEHHHGNPAFDYGVFQERQLRTFSGILFGVTGPVEASSTESVDKATAEAHPESLITVAKSLRVRVVSAAANLGPNIDMMAFWPNDRSPTHLIVCNEEGDGPGSGAACAIVRRQGREHSDRHGVLRPGAAHPLGDDHRRRGSQSHHHPIGDARRLGAGDHQPAGHDRCPIRPRDRCAVGPGRRQCRHPARVGRLAFEGIALYPNGVMYYGDENRPSQGTPGGAYFKFIPTTPWTGSGVIDHLADSPLTAGKVYGLRLGKRSGNTDYGQGSNSGQGTWILVDPSDNANLRAAAASLKLTGYYRPEDADIDAASLADGNVRFCGNNTGNESQDRNWGETICVTDGTLDEAAANSATPEVQYFVMGTADFAMMDNIAYQPGRGNWVINEDGDGPAVGRNNDIWDCLEDGADVDTLSDGCIRVATLNDLTAESTGGIFDADGDSYYVSIQHNVTGHGVILKITGWR